jgi:hypothetical protein
MALADESRENEKHRHHSQQLLIRLSAFARLLSLLVPGSTHYYWATSRRNSTIQLHSNSTLLFLLLALALATVKPLAPADTSLKAEKGESGALE